MTRRVATAAVFLVLAACSPRQSAAWMPRLVVRGGVAQRGALDDAGRASWSWRIDGGLAWRFDRAPAPPVPPPRPKVTAGTVPPPELACVDAALCAWERRARARALMAHEGGAP